MTTSSPACHVPAVSSHMAHYPAAPYPLLFPPVISGLSLPPLHARAQLLSTNSPKVTMRFKLLVDSLSF